EGTTAWRIAFSPDGSRIASAAFGTGLSVVDVTGKPTPGFDPTDSAGITGNDIAWTTDGKQLVVADVNGVVSFWRSDTGRHVRDDQVHSSGAVALDINPAGSTVASASDGLTAVTDIATGETINRLTWYGTVDVSFSADGSRLVVSDRFGTASVLDPSQEGALRQVTANGMSLVSAEVSPTNSGLALVATNEGAPAVWDVAAGYTKLESAIESLPDESVLTASYDGSMHVWSADGPPRLLAPPSSDQIQGASVNEAGDLVAVARSSGAVEVWSVTDARRQLEVSMPNGGAWAVALSPDGRQVAAGGGDDVVVVWDTSTGEQLHSLEGHQDFVGSLEYGADSSQLVSGSRDETAIIWDLDQEEPRFALRLGTGATAVAWNGRGDVVAVAGEDGSVQFWNPATGERLENGIAHAKKVKDIAFDTTGDRLVSASVDRSIIVWDVANQTIEHQVRRGLEPIYVSFSADGRRVLAGDGRLAPHLVYLDGEELFGVAEDKTTRVLSDAECRRYFADPAECPEG
ncbi:MAG TPA: WD40 repeat domain-containing protein, partial [Jiangellaceae bacterium]